MNTCNDLKLSQYFHPPFCSNKLTAIYQYILFNIELRNQDEKWTEKIESAQIKNNQLTAITQFYAEIKKIVAAVCLQGKK